ncbi:deoxyribodipyrimidine photolyase-related protein [Prosthecobacter debontii]|uniref:Deoxyribodipyrimidine photolyase-related protein n=1 Tax=Prosthecobacter debontii TaxID=48467 RepID=A0A1T4XQA0_9BACT|nr:cryptochrome/photolyase family protein [Prosthecobacter debontii]SKA91704.1 deoxyribodipyrimidine photolyase-related protein [Prosthecobacter debontii]
MRHLILILGDQLNRDSAVWDGFDPQVDAVWMAEVERESTKVWNHKARIVAFLAAMRHFAESLRQEDITVHYRRLDDPENHGDFRMELEAAVKKLRPQSLVMVEAGEWQVREDFRATAARLKLPLDEREDRHFMASHADFAKHAEGRKQLRMEYFYREMRQRYGVLMDGKKPMGGDWNYDSENRKSFGKEGPTLHAAPVRFLPDEITQGVMAVVEQKLAKHPGSLADFDWPVTPDEAQQALDDFIQHRLADFGDYQDAMWTNEPWLFHSRLSTAMNLKLLDPRDVIRAAEKAYQTGTAPLAAVEGFIRQILGWREYVRGIYWRFMPGYVTLNELQAHQRLPDFYWTGETDMNCLRETIGQTLRYGYAHHIQRLMVTGLFTLLLGVRPQEVHEWYLAVYVDAVEWVELPNTLGMSQHGDGGIMASKPYIASGKYIQRMSNYCAGCRYDPATSTGPKACPFTTLYWDFLMQHEPRLRLNQRMSMQVRNLARLSETEKQSIQAQAESIRQSLA